MAVISSMSERVKFINLSQLVTNGTTSRRANMPVLRRQIRASSDSSSDGIEVIQESTHNHYRGVACARCRETIPVSSKLANLGDERNRPETNAIHSFPLRCRAYEEEGVYAVADVRDFEGEPTRRRSREQLNHARSRAVFG
jgi:hypothetical protein